MRERNDEQKLEGYGRMITARKILAPITIIAAICIFIYLLADNTTKANLYRDKDPGDQYTAALSEVLGFSLPDDLKIIEVKGGNTGFSSEDYDTWFYTDYTSAQLYQAAGSETVMNDGYDISCEDITDIFNKEKRSCIHISGYTAEGLAHIVQERGKKIYNQRLNIIGCYIELSSGIFIAVFPIGRILNDRTWKRILKKREEEKKAVLDGEMPD
ncbi:MAG: hypothetical protein MJ084_05850 [Saccharofermentans sp.]|nr:hypothetical protein [Saccharofermentans sp.]